MKKRILTVLLAVCLVFALGTVSALAADEGDVAQVGDKTYATLQEAVNAAAADDAHATVTLLADVDLRTGTSTELNIPLGADITIDGDGKTLHGEIVCAASKDSTSTESTVNLTINNLILDGTGITNGYGIKSQNQEANANNVVELTLALNNCTIKNFTYKGLYLTNAKSLTIRGCTFENNAGAEPDDPNTHGDYCVDLNLVAVKGSVISISNTTFSKDCGAKAAIKVTARGTEDGTQASDIKGDLATITSLDIEDCTFDQTGSAVDVRIGTDYKGTNSGAPETCNVENNKTASFDFTIKNSSSEVVQVELAYTKTVKDKATSTPVIPAVIAEVPAGETYTKTPNGDFGESGKFEASVTHNGVTNNYSSLADAIAAAGNGDTVTLLKDVAVSAAGVTDTHGAITITKDITIDGGSSKHKIEITNVPNNDTPSAINIQNNANVTLKNLVIDSNGAKHGLNINSAGTVNLEDVEIMNSAWYAIVCNTSTLVVDELYTHDNQWGVNVDKGSKVTFNSATITEEYSVVVDDGTTSSTNIVIFNAGTYKNIQIKTVNSSVNINGGSYTNIVGGNSTDNHRYTLKGTEASINGGTFNYRQMSAYEDTNYLVVGGSRYSYFNDYNKALAAAGVGYDIICLNNSIDTYEVEFIYEKGVSDTYDVPENTYIYLPTGSYDGKAIEGWKRSYDGEIFDAGKSVQITRDTTFTVILRNGQFDIVIDDDIKHGDVTTDVSSANRGDTVYIYVDPDTGYVLDDLNVYYGTNNRYSVTVSYVRAGVYKFTMPNASVYITATFKYAALPFTDVNRNQWFYDEVFYVYTNGMMEGDSATTFNPDGQMTRAMFWAVLGRIDGANITGANWVDEARSWAMRKGVSDGTNPNDYVTREQMVTMLWRYAGEKNGTAYLGGYTDSGKISSYAVEAMRWAIGNGIIEGMTSTTLVPQGTATRAQCAAIFMRFDQM